MGFSDILRGAGNIALNIGKAGINIMKKRQEQYLYYKNLYADRSDDEVIRMYKNCNNSDKKIGLSLLLKERGLL